MVDAINSSTLINSMQQTGSIRRPSFMAQFDKDSDGGLNQDEFSAFAADLSEKTGQTIDTETLFKQYDQDQDGVLSEDEMHALFKSGDIQLPQPPERGRGGDLLKKIDTDSDGSVSKDELKAFVEELSKKTGQSIDVDDAFEKYDSDQDGKLSTDELKSFLKDNAPKPPAELQQNSSASSGTDGNFVQMVLNSYLQNSGATSPLPNVFNEEQ